MNNTKTIFKSLLIMIVAISLFTVSCSKDESKPTAPATPITITGQNIVDAFAGLGTITIGGQDFDFSTFDGTTEKAKMTGKQNADNAGITTVEQLKSAISQIPLSGATVSADKSIVDVPTTGATEYAIPIIITPNGYNSFGSIKTTLTAIALKQETMTVEVILKLTPDGNWKTSI